MCEQAECAYTYCHKQRDVYIRNCRANTLAYLNSLEDEVDEPLTLTNYFETTTFPVGTESGDIFKFINKRPGWNMLYEAALEGACAEHY